LEDQRIAIVNIKTREITIAGQIPYGSGFWHATGSPDERFAAGDNFAREIYLIETHCTGSSASDI
jgi:hypothetical protein